MYFKIDASAWICATMQYTDWERGQLFSLVVVLVCETNGVMDFDRWRKMIRSGYLDNCANIARSTCAIAVTSEFFERAVGADKVARRRVARHRTRLAQGERSDC